MSLLPVEEALGGLLALAEAAPVDAREIVSLAAATFGAVWLLSGMLLSEHHPHLHGRHV